MPSAENRIVYYYKDGKYYVGTFAEKNVADEYDSSSSYVVGDMVDYLGTLYMCSAATTGTFDSTKWAQIKLANVVETKQDALVSGTNIKTINNQSVLGSGNLDVGAPTTEFTAAEVDALFA